MTQENRENKVYFAKLAEQAERYDEMLDAMKGIARMDVELTVEERNLLCVAFKNAIGSRRASWRVLSSIEQDEEHVASRPGPEKSGLVTKFRVQVESELKHVCEDILDLLDRHLIPSATVDESRAFYYTMKNDYALLLADFATRN